MTERIKLGIKRHRSLAQLWEHMTIHHPLLVSLGLFVCVPLSILATIFMATVVAVMPLAWMFGWL